MQGLVTANTMLVISDIHQHNLDKWQLKRLKSMQGNSKLADLRWLKMPGTKPPKPSYLTIDMDQPDGSIFGNSKEVLNKLYVSLLEQPLHSESLLVFDQVADIDSQVWITMETMNNLQLNAGTWVRVSICPIKPDMSLGESSSETMNVPKSYNNQVSKFSKIKLAQVFPIEENKTMQCAWQNQSDMMVAEDHAEFSYGTAYISAILLFNLLPSPLDDVKSVLLCLERAELRESPPCFAKEVNISVMTSPLTKITNMYDVILTQHFTTPRLISTDDVLCVYCDWKKLDAPATQAVLDEGLPRSHILYFKVNKLVSKEDEESLSYFVDAKQSILFQDNIEQNYVPSVAELFLHNSVEVKQRVSSYWLTTHPGGLETYVSKLVVMLRSLLLNRDQTTDIFPILLSGPPGVGKKTIVMAASRQLYLHIVEVNCYDIIGDTTAATEARLRNSCQKAFTCAPCILLLSNIHCLGKAKDNIDKEPRITTTLMVNLEEIQRVSTHPVLVLGSTSSIQSMTSDLRACFLDEVDIQGPTESQRVEMLQALSSGFLVGPGVSFKALASRTAGMVLSDFCTMFSEAVIQAQDDVMTYCKGLGLLPEMETTDKDEPSGCEDKQVYHKKAVDLQKDICSAGVLLHQCHFDKAIQMLQAAHSDSIGAPKIPSVSWQDIGGLSDVKEEILDTIQLPFQYPELFAAGLQRSGILLYGPPGTGKTLVAKAVATECSLNFLSVKGPELINMYVGQSEENVREVFATASRAAPCVIFFDELDSLAPNRGRSGDSGGVMDRVVSQLLAELDGIQKTRDVFVIGATNRPDLLDPALLRPGRFDTLLYLGISQEKEDRLKIMKALTRKFHLPPELTLEQVVDKCPANLTGADFYALCSNALLNAIRRRIQRSEKAELIQEDFELAIENLVPSVSNEELARYEKIRREFTKNKQVDNETVGELELDGKVIRELGV